MASSGHPRIPFGPVRDRRSHRAFPGAHDFLLADDHRATPVVLSWFAELEAARKVQTWMAGAGDLEVMRAA